MRLHLLVLLAVLACLLAGCATAPQQITPPPAPTVPAVGELIDRAAPGAVRAVGYLVPAAGGALLADSLILDAGGALAPDLGRAIWIDAPPPALGAGEQAGAFLLAELRGTLEGPGQFGPDGGFAWRLADVEANAVGVRELTIPLLLENSGLYEGQAVQLTGQLLLSGDSALLVERVGPGGIPATEALQLKLATPPRDPALGERLQAAGARARFGPVQLTGLWRAGRLYPLAVLPQ
jgi:hypothetical protein